MQNGVLNDAQHPKLEIANLNCQLCKYLLAVTLTTKRKWLQIHVFRLIEESENLPGQILQYKLLKQQ